MDRDSKQADFQILLRSSTGRFGKQVNVGGGEGSSMTSLESCSKSLRNLDVILDDRSFVANVCCWIWMVCETVVLVCCDI